MDTESDFDSSARGVPGVYGMAQIHSHFHGKDNYFIDHIEKGAEILANYLELTGNYLDALTLYKGKSPLGRRQAEHVLAVCKKYR